MVGASYQGKETEHDLGRAAQRPPDPAHATAVERQCDSKNHSVPLDSVGLGWSPILFFLFFF